MEEYGKGLAKLNPCQLLLWAVFLCITTPFLALYDYCRWKFCLEPELDAEIARLEAEERRKNKQNTSEETMTDSTL